MRGSISARRLGQRRAARLADRHPDHRRDGLAVHPGIQHADAGRTERSGIATKVFRREKSRRMITRGALVQYARQNGVNNALNSAAARWSGAYQSNTIRGRRMSSSPHHKAADGGGALCRCSRQFCRSGIQRHRHRGGLDASTCERRVHRPDPAISRKPLSTSSALPRRAGPCGRSQLRCGERAHVLRLSGGRP